MIDSFKLSSNIYLCFGPTVNVFVKFYFAPESRYKRGHFLAFVSLKFLSLDDGFLETLSQWALGTTFPSLSNRSFSLSSVLLLLPSLLPYWHSLNVSFPLTASCPAICPGCSHSRFFCSVHIFLLSPRLI